MMKPWELYRCTPGEIMDMIDGYQVMRGLKKPNRKKKTAEELREEWQSLVKDFGVGGERPEDS